MNGVKRLDFDLIFMHVVILIRARSLGIGTYNGELQGTLATEAWSFCLITPVMELGVLYTKPLGN